MDIEILSVVLTCSLFIIAAYHIHCAYKHRKVQRKSTRNLHRAKGRNSRSSNDAKGSLYASILSFILAIFAQLNFVLLHYYDHIFNNDAENTWPFCEVIIITLPLLYSLWKLIIYSLLTLRLHESFGGSSLAHNTKMLIFFAIVFAIWTTFNISFIIYTNLTKYESTTNYSECTVIHKGFGIISTLLLDGTAGVIFTFLFLMPFGVMAAKFQMKKGHHIKFRQVALKQLLLSITAILSTMVAMFGYTIFSTPELFISFDINVSSICIILMYKWNDTIARRLCCCFLKSPEEMRDLSESSNSHRRNHHLPSRTTTIKTTRSGTHTQHSLRSIFAPSLPSGPQEQSPSPPPPIPNHQDSPIPHANDRVISTDIDPDIMEGEQEIHDHDENVDGIIQPTVTEMEIMTGDNIETEDEDATINNNAESTQFMTGNSRVDSI